MVYSMNKTRQLKKKKWNWIAEDTNNYYYYNFCYQAQKNFEIFDNYWKTYFKNEYRAHCLHNWSILWSTEKKNYSNIKCQTSNSCPHRLSLAQSYPSIHACIVTPPILSLKSTVWKATKRHRKQDINDRVNLPGMRW